MRFGIIAALFVLTASFSPESVAQIHAYFGQEIQVNYGNSTGWETYQDMAVDSKGNLYMVWEAKSLTGSNKWLSVWRSCDAGLSWQQIGYLYNQGADLKYPSIAVGEGVLDRLMIAYVVDFGVSNTYIAVATAPLGTGNFVITYPDVGNYSQVGPPEIWTDASQMNIWRAYVTCTESDPVNMENNVVTWRSDPYAKAWEPKKKVLWGSNNFEWGRPHAAFGTPSKLSFIICCRLDTTQTIHMVYTDNYGVSYSSPSTVTNLMALPWSSVDAQIAAARDYHNLVVCFCERVGDYDELIYVQSSDHGLNWSKKDGVPGWGSYSRFGPELTADAFGGHGFHLAYTRKGNVYHHYLQPDLAGGWSDPSSACEKGYASHADTKKGIACHPETNAAFVCWCDTRDGAMYDTDTYFNYSGPLILFGNTIPVSGGMSYLYLYAGDNHGGRKYLILGGVTGTNPGTPLPGGKVTLPINWDPFTNIVSSLANTYTFQNFYGSLNSHGQASPTLNMPPLNPAFAGTVMYFACLLNNPFDFVSNAVAVKIVN